MNRSQLINILAQKTGLNKKDVKRTIDEMQKLIVQEVKEGQRICLHGFGSFKPRFQSSRPARNLKNRTAVSQDHHSFQMRSPPVGADEQIKNKKRLTFTSKSFFIYSAIVGVRRFELPTTRPPDAYSNRAELHPVFVLRLQR